ncbi:Oligopeptide transport system permease protein OppB [Bienertia sinuspersici]
MEIYVSHAWIAILTATILFLLFSPGALAQIPGDDKHVEFLNCKTSRKSIAVHGVIFFFVICLLLAVIVPQLHCSLRTSA